MAVRFPGILVGAAVAAIVLGVPSALGSCLRGASVSLRLASDAPPPFSASGLAFSDQDRCESASGKCLEVVFVVFEQAPSASALFVQTPVDEWAP